MQNTAEAKKPLSKGFKVSLKRKPRGNLFPIQAQIALAKRAKRHDKSRTRNKTKWKQED